MEKESDMSDHNLILLLFVLVSVLFVALVRAYVHIGRLAYCIKAFNDLLHEFNEYLQEVQERRAKETEQLKEMFGEPAPLDLNEKR